MWKYQNTGTVVYEIQLWDIYYDPYNLFYNNYIIKNPPKRY